MSRPEPHLLGSFPESAAGAPVQPYESISSLTSAQSDDLLSAGEFTPQPLTPCLPANATFDSAEKLDIQVIGSTIKSNPKGADMTSFIISIKDESTQREYWRVAKLYSDFQTLDTKLKSNQSRGVVGKLGKLPEKTLFTSHAPLKNDQRKVALEFYLQGAKSLMPTNRHFIHFLSTDLVTTAPPKKAVSVGTNVKEGYLTKRGKNFGGWKSRYFELHDGVLDYYEAHGKDFLGALQLKFCTVSDQLPSGLPADNEYRHAFVITEHKKGSLVGNEVAPDAKVHARHIFCAESDVERDDWVQKIAAQMLKVFGRQNFGNISSIFVPPEPAESGALAPASMPISALTPSPADNRPVPTPGSGSDSPLPDNADAAKRSPDSAAAGPSAAAGTPNPSDSATVGAIGGTIGNGVRRMQALDPTINQPGQKLLNKVDEDQRIMEQPEPVLLVPAVVLDEKRLAGNSSTSSLVQSTDSRREERKKKLKNPSFSWGRKKSISAAVPAEPKLPEVTQPVFGAPLQRAVELAAGKFAVPLPSVIYRCVEFLETRNAFLEEGIYRLSGSAALIQQLKERFNAEGDVELVNPETFYDVHAISGLLKLYLRELPNPILTRELQRSFLNITDIPDRNHRIPILAQLVEELPAPNYTLLHVLLAHLIRILRHSDVNRMTVRNMTIVFAPTLGIPAGVFALMMTEYSVIFRWLSADDRPQNRRPSSPKLMRSSTLPSPRTSAKELPTDEDADDRPGGPHKSFAPAIAQIDESTAEGSAVPEALPLDLSDSGMLSTDEAPPRRRLTNESQIKRRHSAGMSNITGAVQVDINNPSAQRPLANDGTTIMDDIEAGRLTASLERAGYTNGHSSRGSPSPVGKDDSPSHRDASSTTALSSAVTVDKAALADSSTQATSSFFGIENQYESDDLLRSTAQDESDDRQPAVSHGEDDEVVVYEDQDDGPYISSPGAESKRHFSMDEGEEVVIGGDD
ncbi:uncharacterized protein BJ171DRAFT_455531 [Polychytrium aggregatum]|uniref:uncharacterized protein n=1 Tax=Polychytrium aggregatum TaxID=110093 RepID=UPI0022FE9B4C|nr:uncharacterized protein BJ171DRAFT_455531 [Polychytrium aggregatum]KAI9208273.1 hypothetical protein BJ171DRAFT_455531 [Polychytrium aggregatum]